MSRRLLFVVVALLAGAEPPALASPEPGQTRLVELDAGRGPVSVGFPVTHVGARWRGHESAGIEVRAGAPGRLGPWRALPVAHDLSDEVAGEYFSGLLRADGATALQVRAAGAVAGLKVVAIDAGHTVTASGPGRHPEVVSRAAWGADEGMRKGTPEFAGISKVVVHHTVTPNEDTDPASTVRAIYAYHTRSRGWNDIGYNFLVDAQGRIYEGRFARTYGPGETPSGEDGAGRGVVGAHARGFNRGAVGVAVLGDFSGAVAPTRAALDGLVSLLRTKAQRHRIDPRGSGPYQTSSGRTVHFPNIAGHRDVGETACPGDRLYERLPELREAVAGGTAAPPPAPPPPPPTPPARPVPPPLPEVPGYWTARSDGDVRAFGDAVSAGDLGGRPLAAPIVDFAPSPDGHGYWLAGGDGGVFAFGDAPFLGAATGAFSGAAVDLEPTPSGRGYWVVAESGEVAAFGDALPLGSTAPLPITVAGMAATSSGSGYWLAATDGRVLSFGDALVHQRHPAQASVPGGVTPAAPIVSITASGSGYWLLGADGGVFAFGVPFDGSLAGHLPAGERAVRLRPDASGYYIVTSSGAVHAFGDADSRRRRSGDRSEAATIGMALSATR